MFQCQVTPLQVYVVWPLLHTATVRSLPTTGPISPVKQTVKFSLVRYFFTAFLDPLNRSQPTLTRRATPDVPQLNFE